MRVLFYRSDKPRERILADAFATGVRIHGDEAEELPLQWEIPETLPECDIACLVGVKGKRKFDAHWKAGIHTILFDKGYVRTEVPGPVKSWKYWRVALDGHHPTRYLDKIAIKPERWEGLGLRFKPWRETGKHVVFAGSSEKYHDFYELDDPTLYARKMIRRIHKVIDNTELAMPVIYRPKPSWADAVPVAGAEWSRDGTIDTVLKNAYALVTHGSNAVWESILAGVPCIVTGDAVAKNISSQNVEDLPEIRLASEDERLRWWQALACCQWTTDEMRSGEAWEHIKGEFMRQCV